MMRPFSCAVCALYALQNSMMLTPCWPRAGPTGGAGLAIPALICSLMTAASFFFFGGISLPVSAGCVVRGDRRAVGWGCRPADDIDQILATWENESSTGVSR